MIGVGEFSGEFSGGFGGSFDGTLVPYCRLARAA